MQSSRGYLSGQGPRLGQVSAGFFEVIGTEPILGRTFVEGENLPGSDYLVVISHALWQDLGEGARTS